MTGMLTKKPAREIRPLFAQEPFLTLREEIDDLFNRFLTDGSDGWFGWGRGTPACDLSETADAVQVRMDLPGLRSEDIDVRIQGNLLTVQGERKEEKEEKGRTFHRVERRSGSFARSVTLPCGVKQDKVDAHYKEGVLTLTLPKSEEARAQRISVKT